MSGNLSPVVKKLNDVVFGIGYPRFYRSSLTKIVMRPPGQSGWWRWTHYVHGLSVRPSVRLLVTYTLANCERDVLKTNRAILPSFIKRITYLLTYLFLCKLAQTGQRAKCIQRSTFGVMRSKVKKVKVTRGRSSI